MNPFLHPALALRRGKLLLCASLLPLLLFCGCHSAFVQATITNVSAQPIRIFEVDYPTASFGGGNLAPGAAFHYRFKVLGEGAAKLTWTSESGQDHKSDGPELHEGQEGSLDISIHEADASWITHLHAR